MRKHLAKLESVVSLVSLDHSLSSNFGARDDTSSLSIIFTERGIQREVKNLVLVVFSVVQGLGRQRLHGIVLFSTNPSLAVDNRKGFKII